MKNIVLLHGWDFGLYNKYNQNDPWYGEKLLDELSKYFNVIKIKWPGFCGQPEPPRGEVWSLENFADFLNDFISKEGITPDIILGYSFGGAVAVVWHLKYNSLYKLVLIAPAISRAYKKNKYPQIIKLVKIIIPENIRKYLRHFYLKLIDNKFYTEGTLFLRNTYLNIVKVDLSLELLKINPKSIIVFFGSRDTATPPEKLLEKTKDSPIANKIVIFDNADHDIITSYYKEILNLIKNFAMEY